MDWKNKVIFLTGASSGIGEALALDLAKRGAALGILARRSDLLARVKSECERLGGKALPLVCDITDSSGVRAAAENLRNEFGHINILIANAGIGGNDEKTRSLNPIAVKRVIDTNLIGAVNAVHVVLPEMLERGSGHLVGISSLAGSRGLLRSAAYSASKAGLNAYFESVRLDVQDKGVAVTIIQPGFIKTPLTAGRASRMPFIMELGDAIPLIIKAIEKKKKFAAFPWQLSTIVRAGTFMPAWMYDFIASRARYRE
jgi:NAD(P)-dependent dehydrogenase (short-subunit alcohol dehydrogenase family)